MLRGINVDIWLLAEAQGRPDTRAMTTQTVATLLDAERVASFFWVELVKMLGIARYEATGIDVRGANDLQSSLHMAFRLGKTHEDTEPLPVLAWMMALAPV